jgi:glucokinase
MGQTDDMILAGDIGGTKTDLALFKSDRKKMRLAAMAVYASRDHRSLDEILEDFLSKHQAPIDRACFGVAGPVKNGLIQTTNLAWVVDSTQLARKLRLRRVGLLNDIEATAWGIRVLAPREVQVIHRGTPSLEGNSAVIAAGTGLGEAGLQWNGKEHWPFASEGGHSDFAPRSELELELYRYLSAVFGHVSYERVLSGPGLYNLYRFFRDARQLEEPSWLAEELKQGDPAEVISRNALEANSPLCEKALELFVEIFGAEAGNLALKMMATGGVYLGGGIAPKIAPKLKSKRFMEAFLSKGRLQSLLEKIPVRIILNERAALMGAASWALRQPPEKPRFRARRR